MSVERNLLQKLTLDGEELPRHFVTRFQYISGLDLCAPLVLIDYDDPTESLLSRSTEQSVLSVTVALSGERRTIQNESVRFTESFRLLRKTRSKRHDARYTMLALAEPMEPVLTRHRYYFPQAQFDQVFGAILPDVRIDSPSTPNVPTSVFHCASERGIVALTRYLREYGLMLGYHNNGQARLVDLESVESEPVTMTFSATYNGALHPVMNLRELGSDYLTKQLLDGLPYHVDMTDGEGPIVPQVLPVVQTTQDPISVRRSMLSLMPEYDFLTQPTLKVRVGDRIGFDSTIPKLETAQSVVLRTCLQEDKSQAQMRILTGKVYHGGRARN